MLRARQPAAILFDAAASGVTADLTATLGGITLTADATVGGPVTADLTVTLGGIQLTADATVPAFILDDTHDGDYLGKKLRKERKAVAARRQRVLDLYEQIVEGKQPQPEVVALVEAAGISSPDSIIYAPAIELAGLIETLERAQQLAERLAVEAAIEADGEEVLLLL